MDLASHVFVAGHLVLGVLLLRFVPGRSTTRDMRILLLLCLTAAFGGAVAGTTVFYWGFAVIRLWFDSLYLALVPLSMLVAVLAWRDERRRFAALIGAAALAVLVVCVWATRVEPFRLEISRHVVRSDRLPAGMEKPIVVAILADLQTDAIGAWERRVFDELDAVQADLILLPGDYLQCRSRADKDVARVELCALFDGLRHEPRLGIWAVDGDVDRARDSLSSERVHILVNSGAVFAEDRLQIHGLSTPRSRRPLEPSVIESIDAFDGLTIVVGHSPDFMVEALDGTLDREVVLLAGHTHGGQVVIPGFGPPLTLSRVPRWLAGGRLHRSGKATLRVSRGIGLERGHAPRVRLFCRPELVVLELYGPARR